MFRVMASHSGAAGHSGPDEPPLVGTRVVSLATNVPGPVAAARLVALGAEVTKVEPPSGDFLQRAAPDWYRALSHRQSVVTLDLKSERGRAALGTLLDAADLFFVSSRPAALARLGLDRASVRARHPRLCTVAIVGHASPNADLPGHDLTYQAEAGLVAHDAMPVTLFSDVAAGIEATAAALALLVRRTRTGEGAWREVSLADVAVALSEPRVHGLTRPGAVLGGGFPGYALYEAVDGVVAIAALEEHFMARLLDGLSLTRVGSSELPSRMAAKFQERRVADWVAFGRERDIPIAAVVTRSRTR